MLLPVTNKEIAHKMVERQYRLNQQEVRQRGALEGLRLSQPHL